MTRLRVDRLVHINENRDTHQWEGLCRYCRPPHDMNPITGPTWAACSREVEDHFDKYHPTTLTAAAPAAAA